MSKDFNNYSSLVADIINAKGNDLKVKEIHKQICKEFALLESQGIDCSKFKKAFFEYYPKPSIFKSVYYSIIAFFS